MSSVQKVTTWKDLNVNDASQSAPTPQRKPFVVVPDDTFDPYWTGRLLRSWTQLENPALLPALQRHKDVKNLGRKPVEIIQPQLDLTEEKSELYFPISGSSRREFCRINKIIQNILDKQIRSYVVQNPTATKHKSKTFRKSELDKRVTEALIAPEVYKQRRESRFSLADFQIKTAETLFYEKRVTSPALKSLCLPLLYPGMNRQLYGRPPQMDEAQEARLAKQDDQMPVTGVIRIDHQQDYIPPDVWAKLSKVGRKRAPPVQFTENGYPVFNQLQLRNEVMENVKEKFLSDLRKDINTPLPPELYEDNREKTAPSHDHLEKDEYPPQGPFPWKIEREPPATPEETKIIDAYLNQKKEHHASHQPAGVIDHGRHPYKHIELDWIEDSQAQQISAPMTTDRTSLSVYEFHESAMNIQADLEEAEELPLPDVQFSSLNIVQEELGEELNDDMKYFKREIDTFMGIKVHEDDQSKIEDQSTTTTTTTSGETKTQSRAEILSQILLGQKTQKFNSDHDEDTENDHTYSEVLTDAGSVKDPMKFDFSMLN